MATGNISLAEQRIGIARWQTEKTGGRKMPKPYNSGGYHIFGLYRKGQLDDSCMLHNVRQALAHLDTAVDLFLLPHTRGSDSVPELEDGLDLTFFRSKTAPAIEYIRQKQEREPLDRTDFEIIRRQVQNLMLCEWEFAASLFLGIFDILAYDGSSPNKLFFQREIFNRATVQAVFCGGLKTMLSLGLGDWVQDNYGKASYLICGAGRLNVHLMEFWDDAGLRPAAENLLVGLNKLRRQPEDGSEAGRKSHVESIVLNFLQGLPGDKFHVTEGQLASLMFGSEAQQRGPVLSSVLADLVAGTFIELDGASGKYRVNPSF